MKHCRQSSKLFSNFSRKIVVRFQCNVFSCLSLLRQGKIMLRYNIIWLWHEMRVITCAHTITCTNKKKETWVGVEKSVLSQSCVGWYCLWKILNSSTRIHFNWFNTIHFKLILLTFRPPIYPFFPHAIYRIL